MMYVLAFLVGVQAAILACGYAAIRSLVRQLAAKESVIRALRASHDELQDAVGMLIRGGSETATTTDARVH